MNTIKCPNESCGAELQGQDLRHCPKCGGFLPVETQDAADPLVGQVIMGGKYRVLSIIGEGGMGKVYLADQKLGTATRKVAIKTLQPDLAQDPQIIARFHRETQTVIELEHPNTIKFYDFGELAEHGKKLFVVMEYIQGESLAHVLARGAIEPQRAERILGQVCGSLQEAHEKGIVHRDLKPDNIILTQKGSKGDFVKVLDFGIAKRSEAEDKESAKLTRQGMVLGTPPYMSPEQFTGQALDARSDIYALGIIAYEMLSGVLPYQAATPWEWATKHLTAQPTPLEAQPTGLRSLPRHRMAIARALEKERDRRPASVNQFLQEFTGNSEGSGDWTNASTSLPTGASAGMAANAMNSMPGTGPMGRMPHATPSPFGPPSVATSQPQPFGPPSIPGTQGAPPGQFYPTAIGGPATHTPAPSSAGFAAVPPGVNPGQAGSNPSFPQPVTGFQPMVGQAVKPARKGGMGLVIGIVAGVLVLGGAGFAIMQMSGDDEHSAGHDGQQGTTTTNNADPNVNQGIQGGGTVQANGVPTPQNTNANAIQQNGGQQGAQPDPNAGQQQGAQPDPNAGQQQGAQPDPNAGQQQGAQPDPNAGQQAAGQGAAATPDAGAAAAGANGTQDTNANAAQNAGNDDNNNGGGNDNSGAGAAANARVQSMISRGQAAAGRGDFPSAVAALMEAANSEPSASVVRSFRNDLRRRGRNQINNLILSGDCSGAQQLYRQLRAASAAPPANSFGEACPAP